MYLIGYAAFQARGEKRVLSEALLAQIVGSKGVFSTIMLDLELEHQLHIAKYQTCNTSLNHMSVRTPLSSISTPLNIHTTLCQ